MAQPAIDGLHSSAAPSPESFTRYRFLARAFTGPDTAGTHTIDEAAQIFAADPRASTTRAAAIDLGLVLYDEHHQKVPAIDPVSVRDIDAIAATIFGMQPKIQPTDGGDAGERVVTNVVHAVAVLHRDAGCTTAADGSDFRAGPAGALAVLEISADLVALGEPEALKTVTKAFSYAQTIADGRNGDWFDLPDQARAAEGIMTRTRHGALAQRVLGRPEAGRRHAPALIHPLPTFDRSLQRFFAR